jgi:PD-(D/E)XK nuclease superfamily
MMDTAVKELRLKRPTMRHLKRVSPSRYAAMQACLLREVWTASGNAPLLPPSPRAEIGSIAHRMIEAAGRGELEGVGSERVYASWAALVSETEARMRLSPLTRYQVPLSRSVPHFQVLRLRTYRRAAEIAHDAQRSSGGGPQQLHPTLGFELWVESEDGQVGGFIDRVSVITEGVVLSDYKSGAVLEYENKECPGEVKDAYRIQMELYAALYWQKTGTWPVRLEIVPLQGEPLDVHLDPRHAEHLLDEARAFLRSANDRITAVRAGTADATSLATPQPEHCRLCLFRPACSAYWIARRREPAGKWPADVQGVVQESMRSRNGRICLRIAETDPPGSSCMTVRNITDSVDRHPLLNSVIAGTRVAMYGLRHDYRSGDCTETQSTVIYRTN